MSRSLLLRSFVPSGSAHISQMPSWSGRGASGRSRIVAFAALICFILSTFSLYHYGSPGAQYITEKELEKLTPSEPPSPPEPVEPPEDDHGGLPPLYPELKVEELALPQHEEELPYPEGKNAKFVRFGNQMWGVGLNNQLFEMYVLIQFNLNSTGRARKDSLSLYSLSL